MVDDENLKNNLTNRFKAEIEVLNHATTIADNYSPVIHCGLIRQAARIKILEITKKVELRKKKDKKLEEGELALSTGCKAIVEFTFKFKPEYIEKDFDLFFRDGSTKGHGKVIEVLPFKKPESRRRRYRGRRSMKKEVTFSESARDALNRGASILSNAVGRLFFLFLKSAEHLIPNNKSACMVFINVFRISCVMDTVVRRRVKEPFKPFGKFINGFSMNPELIKQIKT